MTAPSPTAYRCRTCDGKGWLDPAAEVAASNAAEAAFLAAYPRMTCPSCCKRMSPRFDNVDARSPETNLVRMRCHHCDYGFDVTRTPTLAPSPSEGEK